MNKRTLELAKQAGLKVESFMTNPPKTFQILGSTEQFEKFAELIVKECAYLVNDQQRTTGYTTHVQMLCREFEIEFKEEDYWSRGQ